MKMIDIIGYIAVIAFLALMVLIPWALCRMAGKSDDIAEDYWNDYWSRKETEDEQ